MLKGLSPLLTPDLLHALASMGHGDEIAIVDANFPADSLGKQLGLNAGHVRVIAMEQQPKLVEEIRRQYSQAFDQSQIAGYGKQVGAKYIVTGKVYSADERQSDERRVQYFMFIQVLNVETGEILFQHKTQVTKALI